MWFCERAVSIPSQTAHELICFPKYFHLQIGLSCVGQLATENNLKGGKRTHVFAVVRCDAVELVQRHGCLETEIMLEIDTDTSWPLPLLLSQEA